ncbi:CatB-related O-acetyltransferase [Pseudidiomarina atlantica]|uniref:CatB-related O-acetyltransferase n=1 Tax=Pseudidiomarina atlantica TaxID=1517416 RepID=UPI00068E0943|nr:CatB-related O-acetyltransferase [Pseudidiomarina atlantica]
MIQFFLFRRLFFINRNSFFVLIDGRSKIAHPVKLGRLTRLSRSKIGAFSYIGASSRIVNCEIGKFCSIADNVKIGLPTHPKDFISTSPIFFAINNGTGASWVVEDSYNASPKRTVIGHDVWIGSSVTIIGGVKIGNGAIIAAGSVVTKDVPDYMIYGGVPAKKIGQRFTSRTIEQLLELQWWEIEPRVLQTKLNLFNKPLEELDESLIQQFK